jgi:1-deoxy-D-xylulose-5-phosphate synthase
MERSQHLINAAPFSKFWWKIARRFKSSLKGLLMPTRLWEEFGFTYMGPVNGHNIDDIERALRYAAGYKRKPVLLHLITTKGKGYAPAEDDAICFHGISPSNGHKAPVPSYSKIFASTCLDIMKADPKVLVITAAMPEGNSLQIVQQEFPGRVFDVGICEQNAVTFAAGLATQGFKPVVAIYSTFLQRAFDQVIHDVCIQNLPVTFAVDRAGIVGEDGKTHQGTLDLSYLSLIPNMVVSAPKDEAELRHLLYTGIRSSRPFAVRYPRGCGYGVSLDEDLHEIQIGRWELLIDGKDIALCASGITVNPSLEAAEMLAAIGIQAAVVNCRFVKPLDDHCLTISLRK